MDPLLFHLGALKLPVYFTMLATGFALAIWMATRFARDFGLDRGRMVDFGILMVVFGVVGAKVLHIFADGHLADYINVCIDPTKVDWHVDKQECALLRGGWDGALCHPVKSNCLAWMSGSGFAFYGGFIAAALFAVYYIRRHKWPAAKLCDMGGWTIMLGLAWGRMGCFLAGCCFGAQTHSHLGVSFPPMSPASRAQWLNGALSSYRLASLPVHPTQLYESIAALIIAAVGILVVWPKKKWDGQVFVVTMVGYAVARFSLEFIRGDERGGFLVFSTSQWIAILMVLVCIVLVPVFKGAALKRETTVQR